MATNNKLISKEIHLKKRPAGFVTEDDFELVDVEVPEIRKEGEFLVRNIWMSVNYNNKKTETNSKVDTIIILSLIFAIIYFSCLSVENAVGVVPVIKNN